MDNTFIWSYKLQNYFSRCQLAYYYQRIAAKEDALAKELAYIQTLEQWEGNVIRLTLENCLKKYISSNMAGTLDEMQQTALGIMRESWMQYLNGSWKSAPETSTNIFELYYGDTGSYGTMLKLPQEVTDAAKQHIMEAIETYFHSRFRQELHSIKGDNIFFPPDNASFPLEDFRVAEAPDFIYRQNDGKYRCMTWTLGNEYRPSLRILQVCHLLFAMDFMKIPAENVAIGTVFLNDGGRSRDYIITGQELNTVRSQIVKCVANMRSKEATSQQMQNYAPSPSEACALCRFKRLCQDGK